MAKYCGIKVSNAHIDGTSLSVHGKYLSSEEVEESCAEEIVLLEESEPVAININHGYSRDHRSDLKQFTLSLLTTGEEGIPLFMQVGDGNELDQNAFPKMIREFQSQWLGEQPEVYVMDAAFYTEKNLNQCSERMNWISRVPLTIKAAQELTQLLLPEQFSKSDLYEKYSFCAVCSEYALIKQRWIIVESEDRRDADLKTLSKRIEQSLT